MALALISLKISMLFPRFRPLFEMMYFGSEYFFAYLLAVGLQSYPEKQGCSLAAPAKWLLLPLLLWSYFLTRHSPLFADRFAPHALLFSAMLTWSIVLIIRLHLSAKNCWVKWFFGSALIIMIVDFLGNGLALSWAQMTGHHLAPAYSAYQSIGDLFIEVLLAFGMFTVAAVDVRNALERANVTMQSERDRMAMLAHQDALTGCYNRLALNELQSRIQGRNGVVALIDLNNLKPMNDQFGHHCGDAAIRVTAQALKTLMRAHDHVFRIGGDEFVLVAFNLSIAEAERRLQQLPQHLLLQLPAENGDAAQTMILSAACGIAIFDAKQAFAEALTLADERMYEDKSRYKQTLAEPGTA